MKTNVFGIVFLIVLMVFAACNSAKDVNGLDDTKGSTSTVSPSGDNQIDFDVQYIRTNGYTGGVKYPIITVVSSVTELGQYYEKYKNAYNFQTSANSIGFADAIKNYSNDFFTNNFLVLVVLEEGSGSIRHKVESVNENGNIVINRLLPEIGTSDMAEWHIIIKLNNNVKPGQFNVILVNKPAL